MSIVRSFIKNTSGVRTPPVAPSNSSAPTIDDTTPIVGQTLTASPGTWAGSPLPSFSYQWQADTGGNGTFANISGATAQTFVVTSDQSGDDIRVVVTATNAAGSASANSAETSAVAAQDTTPTAFSFTDATAQELSTLVESDAITVAGINWPAAISVTGGEYQKNGGAWTSSPGTVANGDTVKVRHTTSGSQGTNTDTVLTIGGVSDTFRSTTKDTVPAAFSFTDATNADRSTVYESDAITVSGITAAAAISVAGGEYQIGAGAWTSSPGTVTNGQSVKVRGTSSSGFSTAVDVVLTIGGVSDTFRITTLAQDTTPTAFSFTDVTDADLSTVYVAGPITVAGINDAAAISITGGEYRVNGGSWTSSPGTVDVDDEVEVRGTSSASYETAVNVALTIGGVSDTFTITTAAEVATANVILDTDMETDNDDILFLLHALSEHKAGNINLIGVNVCSKFDTSPCTVRALLDLYGFPDIPVGWSSRTGSANPNFFNAEVRNRFRPAGETGATEPYTASATFYRQLINDHPNGTYIVTGGFVKALVEFMDSAADGISSETGMEMISSKEVKVYCGLGRRPADTALTENNSGLDRANANDFTVNWPEPVVFYCFPTSQEVPSLHIDPGRDPLVDPARYAWDLSSNGRSLSGDFGSVTLNDVNDERPAGDNAILQIMLDAIAGTPEANFTLSAVGQLVINATTGYSAWTFPGHGRHRHGVPTTSQGDLDTAWQAIIDGIEPVISAPPVASGIGYIGQTLSVTDGTWEGSPTIAYQWERAGSSIGGQTSGTKAVALADEGVAVRCKITATYAAGDIVIWSNAIEQWVPTDATGLVAWYDAASPSLITESGGSVSAWNDKSGNGHHLSQSTAGSRPTYDAAGNGGRGNMSFADDFMVTTDNAAALGTGNAGYQWGTAYAPGSATAGEQAGDYFLGYGFGVSGQMVALSIGDGSDYELTTRHFNGFNTGNLAATADALNIGTAGKASGANYGATTITVNGVTATVVANNPSNVLALAAGSNISLGGFTNGGNLPAAVDIPEACLFSTKFDSTALEKFQGYLAHRWGRTSVLPGGHAYKTAAPTP